MKRFGAVCVLAFAAVFFVAGCNDYGNTFQGNTGGSLTSISPSIVSAGSGAFTLTLFGGFVATTVVQWYGNKLVTTPVLDANSNVRYLTAAVPANLIAAPGTATVNTLSPHSGSGTNGLSNSIALIIKPAAIRCCPAAASPNAIGATAIGAAVAT